jgi:hypothetical protein
MKHRFRLFVTWVFVLLADSAHAQVSIGTAFTYQGQLTQNGQPFNGSANLVFDLFASDTGGSSLGTVSIPNQAISNGLLTAALDFGVSPFTSNSARWVQVAVNGTSLSPRQRLTPAPFSIATRGLDVGATGNVGIGTENATDRLEVAGGNLVLNGTGGLGRLVFRSTAIGGHQYEWFPDRSGAGALCLYDRTTNYAPLTIAPTGNVGIGESNPAAKLTVAGNAIFSGAVTVTGSITMGASARVASVNPSAFVPQDSFYQFDRLPAGQPALSGTSIGNTMRFYANVQLPQGAVITSLVLQCFDNAPQDVAVTLRAVSNDPSGTSVIGSVTSTGTNSTWQTFSSAVPNVVVNNAASSYMLFATWNVPSPYSNIRLGNIQINYTVTNPAP